MKHQLIKLIQKIEQMKTPVSTNREIGKLEKIQKEIRNIIKNEKL